MWMPRQTHPPTDNRRDCPTYLQKEIQKRSPLHPSQKEDVRHFVPSSLLHFVRPEGLNSNGQLSKSRRGLLPHTIFPPWVALVRVERKVVGPSKIEASVEDEFLGAVAADKDSSSSSNNKRGWMMSREAGQTDGRTKPITGRQRMDRGTGRQHSSSIKLRRKRSLIWLSIGWLFFFFYSHVPIIKINKAMNTSTAIM